MRDTEDSNLPWFLDVDNEIVKYGIEVPKFKMKLSNVDKCEMEGLMNELQNQRL